MYYISKNIWVSISLHALMDYSAFVFSMHSNYVNTSATNKVDILSLLIFIVGILSSYVSLIVYNRKQGKKAWLY